MQQRASRSQGLGSCTAGQTPLRALRDQPRRRTGEAVACSRETCCTPASRQVDAMLRDVGGGSRLPTHCRSACERASCSFLATTYSSLTPPSAASAAACRQQHARHELADTQSLAQGHSGVQAVSPWGAATVAQDGVISQTVQLPQPAGRNVSGGATAACTAARGAAAPPIGAT